jgi:syntaxin 1B/2/3
MLLMLAKEMGAMNGQAASQNDSNAILNACRDIDRGIESLAKTLDELRALQKRKEDDDDDIELPASIDNLRTKIMGAHKLLIDRLRKIKSDPQSGSPRNAPQVGRVHRRLQGGLREFQQTQLDHRNRLKEQNERDVRIIHPDYTDDQVREAAEKPEGPIYTSAVRYLDHAVCG